jgi:Na+/phosphate symporter
MNHPLVNVSQYNDEQLIEKMNDLYSKMNAASFMNQLDALNQLRTIYGMILEEFNRRQAVAFEKQKAKYEASLRIERKPRIRRNHRENPQ